MSLRLSGINPLAYMGVEPYTPPGLLIQTATPTVNDFQNINVGTFWLIIDPQELWYLASVAGGSATWIQLYPSGGSGGASEFICDTGTANEAGGILNVFGDGRIATSGAGNTVSLHLSGAVPSSFVADTGSADPSGGVLNILGGSNIHTLGSGNTITINLDDDVVISGNFGAAGNATIGGDVTFSSLTDGVLQTDGSGVVSATNGTNGQVLIGGGTAPVWANITSLGNTVTITNGVNSINLESEGGSVGSTVAFSAYQPSDTNVALNTIYSYGDLATMTVEINEGGGFYPGDGTGNPAVFTAPVRGYYMFNLTSEIRGLGIGQNPTTNLTATIVGPFNQYARHHYDTQSLAGASARASVSVSALITLNVGEQVSFTVSNSVTPPYVVTGPATYQPSLVAAVNNNITGYLVSAF